MKLLIAGDTASGEIVERARGLGLNSGWTRETVVVAKSADATLRVVEGADRFKGAVVVMLLLNQRDRMLQAVRRLQQRQPDCQVYVICAGNADRNELFAQTSSCPVRVVSLQEKIDESMGTLDAWLKTLMSARS